MGIANKIAHKAEAVKGGAKKIVGRVTGNRRLQAEGRGDQAKGDAKQAEAKTRSLSPSDPRGRSPGNCPSARAWTRRISPPPTPTVPCT
jgi:uncharacterized protein YjbJ (UPF0337 family)